MIKTSFANVSINLNDLFYLTDESKLANYADDNTPYETGKCLECILTLIEHDAETLLRWFENNFLKMNPDKCHLFVPKSMNDVYVRIDKNIIKGEKSVKLLELTLDDKLNFNEHVSSLCKKQSNHTLSG